MLLPPAADAPGAAARPAPGGRSARVLRRDGWRCTAVVDGVRCAATARLEVDPGVSVVVPDSRLVVLCERHHRSVRR